MVSVALPAAGRVVGGTVVSGIVVVVGRIVVVGAGIVVVVGRIVVVVAGMVVVVGRTVVVVAGTVVGGTVVGVVAAPGSPQVMPLSLQLVGATPGPAAT